MISENVSFISFSDTIIKFLKTKNISFDGKNTLTGVLDGMYFPKINAFQSYISERIHDNNQWLYILDKLTSKDIEESMEYYIDESRKSTNPNNHIKRRSVLDNYRTSIYEYFKFLSSNGVKNKSLITTFDLWEEDPDAFIKVMQRVAKKKGLIDSIKSVEPISEDDFTTLMDTCDKFMNKLQNINPVQNEYNYKRYVRALIVKLMLFVGIKCEVLPSIKLGDFDASHNTISINGFCVHLPNKLRDQLYIYTKFREEIFKNCRTQSYSVLDNLFINIDGSMGSPGSKNDISSNQFITGFLKYYIDRSDVIGVSKNVIIKMIEEGINQSVIQNFTGYKSEVYEFCQRKVNSEKSNYDKNRYLDSKLRSIGSFDLL